MMKALIIFVFDCMPDFTYCCSSDSNKYISILVYRHLFSVCRDFASDPRVCLVGRLINRCGSSVFRSLCMVTCGVCEPCESTTERGRAVSEGGTRVIRPEDCEFSK